MKQYRIGIIEDNEDELNSIQRTIYTNTKVDNSVDFNIYELNSDSLDYDKILDLVISDINDEKIMLLIIDNKLLVEEKELKGTSLYKKIKDIVSDFPIIIMTGYREEAYNDDYIDPDKVYEKEKFFSNGDYTKEKINSIFLLMDKYIKLKNDIIAKQDRLVKEYKNELNIENQETLSELLKVEAEMKKYTPVDTTYLESLISPDYVKEIVELLDEIKSKLD